MPVLLMIGDKDTTAIGKNFAPATVRPRSAIIRCLARRPRRKFHTATLVEFPDLGHAPQIQAPEAFHKALLDGCKRPGNQATIAVRRLGAARSV